MIVEFLLTRIGALLAWILSLLPDWNVDDFASSAIAGAGQMGSTLGHANAFLPITELFGILGLVVALIPIMVGYSIFKWIWRHIPTIAGFGTGDG